MKLHNKLSLKKSNQFSASAHWMWSEAVEVAVCELELGMEGTLDPDSGMCASLPDLERELEKVVRKMQSLQLNDVFNIRPFRLEVWVESVRKELSPSVSSIKFAVQNPKSGEKRGVVSAPNSQSFFFSAPWGLNSLSGATFVEFEFTKVSEWTLIASEAVKSQLGSLKTVNFSGDFYAQSQACAEAAWGLVSSFKELDGIVLTSFSPRLRIQMNRSEIFF
ncbi:MAG: hypothetical protein AB7O96_16955 [Pseudobdellovibrionaceae bacterium]